MARYGRNADESERAMNNRDLEIRRLVRRELRWDPQVAASEVRVDVDAGIVILTGTVNSWANYSAAQEAAYRVRGVLDVANDLDVRAVPCPEPSDAKVARVRQVVLSRDAIPGVAGDRAVLEASS